jgi:hypothetical protein
LVNIANAQRTAEEVHAFHVVWLASAFDVREHVVRDRLDIRRTKECIGLRRHLIADILTIKVIAFGDRKASVN